MVGQIEYDARNQTGYRLCLEREFMGINLKKLARLMGISATAQSHYENGEIGIPLDYLHGLEKYGFNILYIAFGRANAADSNNESKTGDREVLSLEQAIEATVKWAAAHELALRRSLLVPRQQSSTSPKPRDYADLTDAKLSQREVMIPEISQYPEVAALASLPVTITRKVPLALSDISRIGNGNVDAIFYRKIHDNKLIKTLNYGDIALIDTSQKAVRPVSDIMFLSYRDRTIMARARITDEWLVLFTDEDGALPIFAKPSDVTFLGRVVGVQRAG